MDSKDNIWDSVSPENHTSCEELTFANSTKLKNRGLQSKISYDFIDSEREEEPVETWRESYRENLSPKTSAKYRTSKSEVVEEKPKVLQSSTLNANFRRVKSPRSIEQTSNVKSAGRSK